MAIFKISDKVIADGNRHGTVIGVIPPRRGRQLYKVTFLDGETADRLEADLCADFDESDPFERCKKGIFGSYSEYAKRNTTFKIRNSNNSTISSLKASKTLFRPYQFKPLLKFLNSPNHRLLVADEVGLGKTIEAGHIMLELKARRELKDVLIVCPKSLQEKWKGELFEKFGLSFKIYETSKELISDMKDLSSTVHAIVNYEKIRTRRSKKEKDESNGKQEPTNLVDFLNENPHRFSLVLCDEAHKMRNKETQTYRGAEIVMAAADTALFLTATPVMINEENLYNLLHLLDNTRYFNYQIFQNRLNENRPFVEALSNLNTKMSLTDILTRLAKSMVEVSFSADEKKIYNDRRNIIDIFGDDPIFKEVIELLHGEDSPKVRARIQYLLSSLSVMNTVFSRTRKREVTTDMSQAERSPHLAKVTLYDDEQEEYDQVIKEYTEDNSYEDYWGEERLSWGKQLGLIQRKRMIASSVYGYLNSDDDLDKGIDQYADCPDGKVDKLIEIIEEVFSKGGTKKLVVFAIFRRTLKYLQIRLKRRGYNSLLIHGQVENRHEILDRFKKDRNIHILLSSEVGSEGLDMQFCNSMVNYDLPWNPMVVEQRIGRIDRFGQKAKYVNIYNMVVSGSIQEEIYMRLLDRIGIFRGTIGDMEAILDAPMDGASSIQDVYNKMEREFFTKELSKADREKKIAEVERAIENEKENLKHLQEGLSNTLTNDAYFKDEINRILYKNAYVTEEELCNYIKSLIRQKLTTCSLESVGDGVYEFKVSVSDASALRNFLFQHGNETLEHKIAMSQFMKRLEDNKSFTLTFNQEKAYEDASLHYLNLYHPMIQACLDYFNKEDDSKKTSFSYSLNADELLNEGATYYMGLYELKAQRMMQGVAKKSAELLPVVYNVKEKSLVTDQDIIDRLYRRSQVEGYEHNALNADTDEDIIEDMRGEFAVAISDERKKRTEEANKQIESDRQRNEQQTKEYYKSRIANHESNISTWESYLEAGCLDDKEERRWTNAIRLANANIAQLERERDDQLSLINEDSRLSIEGKILSINLITII